MTPDPDIIELCGHRVLRDTPAARHLRDARGNEEMAAWARTEAPAAYDRYVLCAASDIECAINAPGYIGPATNGKGRGDV